ncbi:MAG: hypothetical protein JWO77_1365 [Ilumatobacteraceae bacterium]|nr:hypothetical protein [Ilumatobacteraceae bacterium]
MALQGDLKSFALPDVLRLLAGTGKSGVLEVANVIAAGEVTLRHGTIASAATTVSPRATDPADVVYELLRFEDGSFVFEEGEIDETGMSADVDATIEAAAALVEEWIEIEAVIPSMEAWVSLAPELAEEEIIISADRWRALVAVGAGGNVHDLAAGLGTSDLAVSRQLVGLVEAGLVQVRASHGYQPPRVELDDFDDFEAPVVDPITDLHDLSAEDRPVVMEESDDALLPEPLPGEGVAYEGEAFTGVVDGRSFESVESPTVDGSNEAFAPFDSLASFEAAAAMSDRIGEPGTIDTYAEPEIDTPVVDPYGFGAGSHDGEATMEEEPAEVHDMPAGAPSSPVDDERDSLLKFLSSVKP